MAMKRLKELRKDQVESNKDRSNNKKKQHQRKVDYVLVFAGSKKNGDEREDQENDESYLYLDNLAKEKITQTWTQEGGSIGGNNLDPDDPIRKNPMYVVTFLLNTLTIVFFMPKSIYTFIVEQMRILLI